MNAKNRLRLIALSCAMAAHTPYTAHADLFNDCNAIGAQVYDLLPQRDTLPHTDTIMELYDSASARVSLGCQMSYGDPQVIAAVAIATIAAIHSKLAENDAYEDQALAQFADY